MTAGRDGAMLRDVRRQPAVHARLLARAPELRGFAREHLVPDPGGALWATGCGDGWFAARAAAALAGGGPHPYRPRAALPFLVYDVPAVGPADRVLVISMSGNVDRSVEAAEAALARGAQAALLTNGDGGRAGALGIPRVSLEIEAIAPFLCGTTSYTASVLALALALGPEGTVDAAKRLASGLEACLDAAEPVVRDLARAYTGVRFLSSGANLATADYGAAKLVELTRLPAWSDDIEEFAHRQFWNADPGELVVYLAANPGIARFADESARALAGMGFATLGVETEGNELPSTAHRVALPRVEEALSPLPLTLPLQLLALHLARATGLDPDTRAHLKDDGKRFETSRRLTRRSLLGTGA